VWFSTSSRSNLDGETTAKIVADRELPLSIVIPILTVVCPVLCLYLLMLMFIIKIEHALKEWENGKKAHNIAFGEDIAKHRLDFLLHVSINIY